MNVIHITAGNMDLACLACAARPLRNARGLCGTTQEPWSAGEPLFGEDWQLSGPDQSKAGKPVRSGLRRGGGRGGKTAAGQAMLPWFEEDAPGGEASEPVRGDGARPLDEVAAGPVRGDRGPAGLLHRAGHGRCPGPGRGQLDHYRPRSQDDLAPSRDVSRVRANIEAVPLLKLLQREQRPATLACGHRARPGDRRHRGRGRRWKP